MRRAFAAGRREECVERSSAFLGQRESVERRRASRAYAAVAARGEVRRSPERRAGIHRAARGGRRAKRASGIRRRQCRGESILRRPCKGVLGHSQHTMQRSVEHAQQFVERRASDILSRQPRGDRPAFPAGRREESLRHSPQAAESRASVAAGSADSFGHSSQAAEKRASGRGEHSQLSVERRAKGIRRGPSRGVPPALRKESLEHSPLDAERRAPSIRRKQSRRGRAAFAAGSAEERFGHSPRPCRGVPGSFSVPSMLSSPLKVERPAFSAGRREEASGIPSRPPRGEPPGFDAGRRE